MENRVMNQMMKTHNIKIHNKIYKMNINKNLTIWINIKMVSNIRMIMIIYQVQGLKVGNKKLFMAQNNIIC